MPNSDINKNFLALEENIRGINLKKIKRIINDKHSLQVEYASNIEDLKENIKEKENKENIGKYAKNIIAKFYIDSIKEKIEPLGVDKNPDAKVNYSIRGFKSLDKTKRNIISLFIKKIKEDDFKDQIEQHLELHWKNSIVEIKEIEERELNKRTLKIEEEISSLSASHDEMKSKLSDSRSREANKSTQTNASLSNDYLDDLSEITSDAETQSESCEWSERGLSCSFLDSAKSREKEALNCIEEDDPSISHTGPFSSQRYRPKKKPSVLPSPRSKNNLCEYASCQIS